MKINFYPCIDNYSFGKKNSADDDIKNTKLIEDALYHLAGDPKSEILVKTLSDSSGLNTQTIRKLFKSDCAQNLYAAYKILADERNRYLNRKRKDMARNSDYKTDYSAVNSISRLQKKRRSQALYLIKNAIDDKRNISYQEIEKLAGLKKPEVDELINEYVSMAQKAKQIEKATKELQAKWYEENQNKNE